MQTDAALKQIVQEKYGAIADQDKDQNAASCCGATPTSNKIYNIMMDDYSAVAGYNPDADLGLGCGLPTAFAQIKTGDTVIDLGSGAGNDCFVARHETGPTGKVIGIDFTDQMIAKARANADKLGLNNVEFRQGDIEKMPVTASSADVVISNCVLNLVPNKRAVISEIFRVLKPGAHFSISDIVLVGELPEALRQDATMYAGCVAGAVQKDEYLEIIAAAGFASIQIQKEKPIELPADILEKYLRPAEIREFQTSRLGIFSITVYAVKPLSAPHTETDAVDSAEEAGAASCCSGSSCC
ncbi:MAG: arsenite methyltransferase [Leptospiraceae bacterium]|nr:arsenite methyltransferase [Leptospiraceae bacterium]